MEIGIVHVEATAAGAPATIPEGHLEYHKDTDKLYKSDGTTKTELAAGGTFTTEDAQDAVGAMVDTTLVYTDATPLLSRAALTGDVTASAGSNATTIANDAVTFAKMQNITSDRLLGRDTAGSGNTEELTVGSGIEFTGSTGIVSSSRTLDIDSSLLTWNTSAAETTIYSYTIPAGTIGASDKMIVNIENEYYNNTAANRGFIVRVKLGGTAVIEVDSANFFVSSTTRRLVLFEITLSALGATNSQRLVLRTFVPSFSGLSGTVITGTGSAYSNNIVYESAHSGTLSQDMTASKVFEVSIQLSSSSASHEWTSWGGCAELKSV